MLELSFDRGPELIQQRSWHPCQPIVLSLGEEEYEETKKNAKPNCVNKKLAFHEDMELDDFLVSLCQILDGGLNLLSTCTLYHI